MEVGDLVKWADCQEFCGIVLEIWGDHECHLEVLVWFNGLYGRDTEWCFAYDLEVVCR